MLATIAGLLQRSYLLLVVGCSQEMGIKCCGLLIFGNYSNDLVAGILGVSQPSDGIAVEKKYR